MTSCVLPRLVMLPDTRTPCRYHGSPRGTRVTILYGRASTYK